MPPWGWVFSLSFFLEFWAWVLVFSAAGVKKKAWNRGFPDVGYASGPPNIGLHATSQIFYYFLYFFEKGEDRGGPGVGVVLWIVADWPPASDGAKNIKIHFQYTAGRRIVGYVSYTFMVKRKSLWCEREGSSCYRVMDKVYRPKILNSNIGPKVICY